MRASPNVRYVGASAASVSREIVSERHVLVVDDNVDAAEMLAALIETRGHRVSIAHDGPHALELARTRVLDVVLLDIEMPVMNGYEVARALRADPALANVQLIAVSGHAAATDRNRSRLSDFDAHMVDALAFFRQIFADTALLAARLEQLDLAFAHREKCDVDILADVLFGALHREAQRVAPEMQRRLQVFDDNCQVVNTVNHASVLTSSLAHGATKAATV